MEMAPGALPRPGRVLEQRLLSPKICFQGRRCCGTVLEISLIHLGFGLWKALNRQRGSVRGPPGGITTPGHGQEGWRAPSWCACPLALLWLSFGLRSSSEKNRGSGTCSIQFR
jgi:hypothetical protein